ncbi:MAG: integrase [Deltaproteobacteria bacterium]|nr:integrase [Deltaproteobacteria bacterium]MBW2535345.1 integrase [Deltaproteobacteria bacterium]
MATVAVKRLSHAIRCAVKPTPGLVCGRMSDLSRSRRELLGENALLRQQLIVLRRCAKRPKFRRHERGIIVWLTTFTRSSRETVLVVKPETILRWHRAGFYVFSRRGWRTKCTSPRIASNTIDLIKRMAVDNHLWGAERIRGELLKLGARVSKRTIQKYIRSARGPRPWDQGWSTTLTNHANQIWACDFLQTYDISFRPLFALFIVEHRSRRVVHVGVTRAPTSRWTAQQLRSATPFGEVPRFVIRDNDDKLGVEFDHVARASGIRVLRTPFAHPEPMRPVNASSAAFAGSVSTTSWS